MLALLAAGAIGSADRLIAFAEPAWRATPEMRVQDAYKWLFHATLGGEHAVTDDAGPRRWMTREWATLTAPRPGESETQRLDPDGRVLRVHLRPYRGRGGDSEMLLAVFVASARQFRAPRSAFVEAWTALDRRLSRGRIGHVDRNAWATLDRGMRAQGYPAVHHSPEYETAYRPAYRVVLGALWVTP